MTCLKQYLTHSNHFLSVNAYITFIAREHVLANIFPLHKQVDILQHTS